jgi:hypothetical protein
MLKSAGKRARFARLEAVFRPPDVGFWVDFVRDLPPPRLPRGDGLPRAVGETRTPLPFRSPTMPGAARMEAFG